jgi:hypothetical protein
MSRVIDLTGQTFGRLTVLGRADDHVSSSGRRFAQWQCKCECGKDVIVIGSNLKKGKTQSCGCLRAELDTIRSSTDLSGQRFSRLTVISRADDIMNKNGTTAARWKCVCDCGNETIVRAQALKNGSVKSCGCLRRENMDHARKHSKNSFIDLTGQTFGRLTVLDRADDYVSPSGNKLVQWHCKCECGKDVVVAGNLLKAGRTRSCGCLRAKLNVNRSLADLSGNRVSKENMQTHKGETKTNSHRKLTDLSGQRFSRLTVISRADDYVAKNGTRQVCWRCVCDCGNETIVRATSLKDGDTQSCGCLRAENSKRKLTDLSGQRFARLTVISRADNWVAKNGTIVTRWRCVCDCGNETIVRAPALKNGSVKSCGCLRREAASLRFSKNNGP